MKKTCEVKERIIEVTIALIQNSNGRASEITTRDIAEKAEVGNGLINYHFQTKENLIAICVQRIIGQVVDSFKPNISNIQSVGERMIYAATEVFEFLFSNPAISRISILGDFSEPAADSNTAKSQQGIFHVLGEDLGESDKKIFSFVLVSAMQAAFLANQFGAASVGYKLDTPASREAFMTKLVNMLLHGVGTKETDSERETIVLPET